MRYSQQNAQTMDPAIFGIYGGLKPFAGTGTNPTQSVGGTYNRVWSATLVQEVRFGRTHHHNEAIGEDYGLTTSQDLGIKGINLNDFTSGITTIDVGGYSDYLIGFETSLPWDREESTMDGVDDRDEDVGQSHDEGRWRPPHRTAICSTR